MERYRKGQATNKASMKHWYAFYNPVDAFLRNIEYIDHMKVAPIRMELDFQEVTKRLKTQAKRLYDKPYSGADEDLYFFISEAKYELSDYLVDRNKREGTIKKVNREFESIHNRFKAVTKEWGLNHVKHKATFYHGYFDLFQPVYDFYNWFLVEAELYKWEGKQLIPIQPEKDMESMKLDVKQKKIRQSVGEITPNNVEDIYTKNFKFT